MQYFDVSRLESVKKYNSLRFLKFVKIGDVFYFLKLVKCEFSNYGAPRFPDFFISRALDANSRSRTFRPGRKSGQTEHIDSGLFEHEDVSGSSGRSAGVVARR